MRTVRQLVSRVSFVAVGVGVGVILAGGSGLAAVHISQTAATKHSINAVQPAAPVADDRIHPEDSSPTPRARLDDATEPAQRGEAETADDSRTRATSTGSASTDKSGAGSDDASPKRSPEPGDDHGHDGSR